MGTEVVQYRICDRCFAADREVTAEETDRLILNGHRFDIDLCRDCSAELYTLVTHTWGAVGKKTGEPTVFDAPRRISTAPVPVVHPSGATAEMAAPALKIVRSEEMPSTAERWRLTTHAEQRMLERGFDIRQVLWAAERPDKVLPHGKRQDVEYHHRGDITVLVSKFSPDIVTVLFPHEAKTSPEKVEA